MNQTSASPKRRPAEHVVALLFGRDSGSVDVCGKRKRLGTWLVGLAAYTVYDNGLLMGGEGSGGANGLPAGAGEVRFGSGIGAGEAGAILQQSGAIRFYLLAGAGGAGKGTNYYRRPLRELMRDRQSIKPEHADGVGGPHLLVGLGFEARLGGRVGLVFGVRLGYLSQPLLIGNRAVRQGGPFTRLMMGIYVQR